MICPFPIQGRRSLQAIVMPSTNHCWPDLEELSVIDRTSNRRPLGQKHNFSYVSTVQVAPHADGIIN